MAEPTGWADVWSDSSDDPLDRLSTAAGEADAAYAKAVAAQGEATAEYEYAYWLHHTTLGHLKSEAARDAACQEHAINWKVAKVRADAAEKRCAKHLQTLLARLSAEQTKDRRRSQLT